MAGGGGAGGGGGGASKNGKGKKGLGKKKGKKGAKGGKKAAADAKKYPKCGTKSHPVDVATGRVFTLPVSDLDLPGLIDFSFERTYSSFAAHIDVGLGAGWTHAYGWSVECRRRSVLVWNDNGVSVEFPALRIGDEIIGEWGWVLRREPWGYAVDADDGTWRLFSAPVAGNRYLLTAVEDRNRNRIALTYEDGRLAEIVDSVGRQIVVIPASNGQIGALEVRATPPSGGPLVTIVAATYRYDDAGMLIAVTDAEGFSSRYSYDTSGRLVLDCDRAGLTFHFLYDKDGRCIESWGDYPGKTDPSLSPTVPLVLADGITPAKGVHHCRSRTTTMATPRSPIPRRSAGSSRMSTARSTRP